MRKIAAIATITFKEELRSRLLYVSVLLVAIVAGSSKLFTSITPGSEKAFVVDISIGAISFLASLTAIVGVSDIISREVRRKTLYTIVTNPVNPVHVILGKFLGMVLSIGLAITVMNALFIGIFYLFFRSVPNGIFVTAGFLYLQIFMLIALGILGSTSFSMPTNILWCVFLYILGNMVHQLHQVAERTSQAATQKLVEFAALAIPDFERLKTLDWVVADMPIPPDTILPNLRYGLIYIAAVLLIAVVLYGLNNRMTDL